MLRQPCLCSKRHFSSLFESFELGIEAEESPRGRLERGSVGDELQPELTKSERSEHLQGRFELIEGPTQYQL